MLYLYFETLNMTTREPDQKFFRLAEDGSIAACLGFQAGGWQPTNANTFKLFKDNGLLVEVTEDRIRQVRKENNLHYA